MPFTGERLRSRHPFQIFMLLASVVYSGAGLISREVRPGSIQETVGRLGTNVWLACVLLGALAALVSAFLRDRATGLAVEEVGLLAAGAATLFYTLVALYVHGLGAAVGVSVMVGFGAACVKRSWDLHRILTSVRKGRGGYVKEG